MKKFLFIFILCVPCLIIQAKEGSVVCIHGFMTTYRSMYPVKGALKDTGFDIYLWGYPSRRRTIEESAQLLVCFLKEVACCKPGKPIHFVTHSIGGLVLRAALNFPGCPEEAKIGNAVLLAPPNRGSSLARRFSSFTPVRLAMGSKSGRQLMYYTERDINCLGSFPEEMPVLVIAGCKGSTLWFDRPNDIFLAVSETGLNTPFYWKVFPVTHGKLLKYRTILQLVRQFLCDPCPSIAFVPDPLSFDSCNPMDRAQK